MSSRRGVRYKFNVKAHPDSGSWTPWFSVYIYDTVQQMRAAATALEPNGEDFSQAYGLVQSSNPRNPPTNGFAGTIRFAMGSLDFQMIAHEATHAAATAYRMNYADKVNLGDNCRVGEERFAYLVGGLCEEILFAMAKLGLGLEYDPSQPLRSYADLG